MLSSQYRSIAHRGLHDKEKGVPENSLPAFQRAMDAGVAIELDVHLSGDGEVVVFHDDDLFRMTGKRGRIEDMTCKELAPLRLAGTECGIPLMKRALQLVNGRVPILIELKDNGFSGCLAEALLGLLSDYRGDFMIQSFNPYAVWWFLKHAPRIKRGQLSQKSFSKEKGGLLAGSKQALRKRALGNLWFNWITKPDFIAYNIHDMTPEMAKKWKKQGYGILAWTVRTEGELRKARWLCDGAIFERMELREVREAMEKQEG